MRTVTHEEVQASEDRVHNMTKSETLEFMGRMMKEQPYIQVYAATICEQGEWGGERDADTFASLVSVVWHAMRSALGRPFDKVKGFDLDKREEQLAQFCLQAGEQPEPNLQGIMDAWTKDYNQLPLLQFVIDALMSPDSPYEVTKESTGAIFMHLKVIMDCLDNAKPKRLM